MTGASVELARVRLAGMESSRLLVDVESLVVSAGEHIALVGSSGAGKTLISRFIAGVLPSGIRVLSGVVKIAAVLTESARTNTHENKVTMIPQMAIASLPPLISALDMVVDTLRWSLGLNQQTAVDKAVTLLERVGIDRSAFMRRPHELSGGMAQRVVLAAALATEPSVLILDEPTSGLDPIAEAGFVELIRDILDKENLTFILVTHAVYLAAHLCHRGIVVKGGHIVAQGDLRNLAKEHKDCYVANLLADLLPTPQQPIKEKRSSHDRPRKKVAVFSARNISVQFDKGIFSSRSVQVLHNVSLEIQAASSVGLIGPSGAGKSTFALVCAGLLRPKSGSVFHENIEIFRVKKTLFSSKPSPVQMVFQNSYTSLNPTRTMGSWLSLLLNLQKKRTNSTSMSIHDLLSLFDIKPELLDAFPGQLSGGECQRAALAAAIAAGAKLIILDEPLSMLDPIAYHSLIGCMKNVQAKTGCSYLVITHDLTLAEKLCDEIVVMSQGRIVETGLSMQVLSKPTHNVSRALIQNWHILHTFPKAPSGDDVLLSKDDNIS